MSRRAGFPNVSGSGELPVARFARDDSNLHAAPFGYGGIVRKIVQTRIRRPRVSSAYEIVAESLRCLGGPQTRSVHRTFNDAVGSTLESVGNRHGRNHTGVVVKAGNHPAHQVMGNKWTGGIMYKNIARRGRSQGLEPPVSRLLSGRSAGNGGGKVEPCSGFAIACPPGQRQ